DATDDRRTAPDGLPLSEDASCGFNASSSADDISSDSEEGEKLTSASPSYDDKLSPAPFSRGLRPQHGVSVATLDARDASEGEELTSASSSCDSGREELLPASSSRGLRSEYGVSMTTPVARLDARDATDDSRIDRTCLSFSEDASYGATVVS